MKITKAHIQVSILTLGVCSVAGIWLAPKLSLPHTTTQTTPSHINASVKAANTSAKKAAPTTQPAIAPPKAITPPITLDAHGQKIVERSETLSLAKIDAQIAQEESKARKAKPQTTQGRGAVVPPVSVIGAPYSPPNTVTNSSSQQAIDRFALSGLFIDAHQSSAYLSFDDGQPFLVKAGQRIKGVTITAIDAQGVQLTQGKTTRTLEGGL